MSKYIDNLIYDRTVQDIQEMTTKAYIDYQDLNRIELAIKWVSHVLNQYGYRNATHNKVNWHPEDRRTDSEMERLRKNIAQSGQPITRAQYAADAGAYHIYIYLPGKLYRTDYP